MIEINLLKRIVNGKLIRKFHCCLKFMLQLRDYIHRVFLFVFMLFAVPFGEDVNIGMSFLLHTSTYVCYSNCTGLDCSLSKANE